MLTTSLVMFSTQRALVSTGGVTKDPQETAPATVMSAGKACTATSVRVVSSAAPCPLPASREKPVFLSKVETPVPDTLCDFVQNRMCAGPDYIFYNLLSHSTSTTGLFLHVDALGSAPLIMLLETQSFCACSPQSRQATSPVTDRPALWP